MAKSMVKLPEYLFTRLRQLGLISVHGVPGDYNLTLLDYVVPQGLLWVGNCNELNAGYAADGYARLKGIGALITTFGVGELSAINAIAGAYSELAPVVHIVGTPARFKQEERALIHHALGDGDYDHFSRMAKEVTVAQANLLDPRTAAQQIDTTLQQCLLHSRPVYIQVPVDMVEAEVSAEPLGIPIEISLVGSPVAESAAIEMLKQRVYASERPMILVDGEIQAYGVVSEVDELIRKTNWPVWTTSFGKSLVDETLDNYYGIWQGSIASEEVADYVKSADLILCFGPHFSLTNTYAYTAIPESGKTIFFKSNSVQTAPKQIHRDVPLKALLARVLQEFDFVRVQKTLPVNLAELREQTYNIDLVQNYREPTQDEFYKFLSPWLRPGDVILAETGTAGHGCRDFRLPPHTFLFKPTTWLSIGYMLPAAQGAALAQRELAAEGKWHTVEGSVPRTILLIGDGSFQMTVQEISTMLKHELNVLIILINNDGYTIERCIHGARQPYNDIAPWRYLDAASFLGASLLMPTNDYHVMTNRAETWGEVEICLKQVNQHDSAFRMIEVMMDKEDAPDTILSLGELAGKKKQRQEKDEERQAEADREAEIEFARKKAESVELPITTAD